MNILVLEASTTSAKALLYDTDACKFDVKVRAYTGNYEDVTIHDAENVYGQMIALGREVAKGKDISMISLSGTWHSLLLCDSEVKPVTPVYLWGYRGAAKICQELRDNSSYIRWFYNKTGCMVNALYPVFKLHFLKKEGYDLSKYYILGQGTYNNYRLTGKRITTECLASGTGLFNIYTKTYDPEILKEVGIAEEQLSEVVDYRHTYPLTEEAARELGVKAGIPVIPTSADGGLNQVGVGASVEGVMTFSVGTSGAIRLTTKQPVLPQQPSTWCYMSPKTWLSGAATNGCCNCIDWYKNHAFGSEVSYADIENGITDCETNPVFLPFLFGERCPGWNDERKGGFLEILPRHKRNDLYLSVQEGVLFNLFHCYQLLTKVNQAPTRIKFSGGILNSPAWSQMCADIFKRDLEVDNNKHGSLLGGAVLAMELAGVIDDVREFDPAPAYVIHPNPDMETFYEQKFERYMKCYKMGR